jgi:hypothetical protein
MPQYMKASLEVGAGNNFSTTDMTRHLRYTVNLLPGLFVKKPGGGKPERARIIKLYCDVS